MPGWLFDMDVRPATGYVMILHTKYSPFAVFTSDQTGVIYRAKFTGDALPKANSLDAAGDPGAVPYGQNSRRARYPTHEPHFKHRFMINQAR
jgi:hypothetical protein